MRFWMDCKFFFEIDPVEFIYQNQNDIEWLSIIIADVCLGLKWEIWEDKHVYRNDFHLWLESHDLCTTPEQCKALIDWVWYLSIWMVHVWLLGIHSTPWRYHHTSSTSTFVFNFWWIKRSSQEQYRQTQARADPNLSERFPLDAYWHPACGSKAGGWIWWYEFDDVLNLVYNLKTSWMFRLMCIDDL